MTYTIFSKEGVYWFRCRSSLAINHGPFKTWEEAKQAADLYTKNF